MAAPFHAIRDQAIAAVDAVMAEEVRLLFLDAGRADASRANASIKGVLRVGGSEARTPTAGKAWASRIAAGRAELYVSRAEYGANPALRVGDKVKAVERAGAPIWEVAGVDDRRHDRLVIDLSEA